MEMGEFNISLQHSFVAADRLKGRTGDDESVGRRNTLLEEKVITNVQHGAQGGSGKGRVGSHTAGYNDVSILKGPAEGTAKPEPTRCQNGVCGSFRTMIFALFWLPSFLSSRKLRPGYAECETPVGSSSGTPCLLSLISCVDGGALTTRLLLECTYTRGCYY